MSVFITTVRKLLAVIIAVSGTVCLYAQDIHFNDVQNMQTWYNQSLKLDRTINFAASMRKIEYQNLVAFSSGTLIANIPLLKKANRMNDDKDGYLTTSAGFAYDKSNRGIYKNTIGLLGVAYTRQITRNRINAALGFQGTYTNNQMNFNNAYFPDQFNVNGPSGSATNDPLRNGRSYSWFSLNAGASVFRTSETQEWYLGLSVRHINNPYTDIEKTIQYKLSPTMGGQAGVTFKNDRQQIGVYGNVNWKAEANEYIVGFKYGLPLKNLSFDGDIFFGCAYRVEDAIIPNIRLGLGETTISFFYDHNISGIKAATYNRRGYELTLTHKIP